MTRLARIVQASGAGLWAASATVAIAAHIGVAAALLTHTHQSEQGQPGSAIVVELAADPASTQGVLEASGPQAPEEVAASDDAEASHEEPPAPDSPSPKAAEEPQTREQPIVEPAPPPAGPTEVVLPTPQPRERVEQEAAPPQRTIPSDARPPATQAAAGGGRASAARIATWRSALALRLAHAKRYPADAQARQQQGVAKVRFTLDARGHVLTRALVDSSGVASLDAESLALIERAQPFPAPPSGISPPVEVVVPVRFSFR